MVSTHYYRTEAERCRQLAEAAKDSELAKQWHKLARDYELLAESLAAHGAPPPPIVQHFPMQQQPRQQQPMQQQQSKTEPEDDK